MRLWFKFLLIGLLLLIAVVLARQWSARIELQAELTEVRARQAELANLRAEHQRLIASQISAEELENLRADHAAIGLMRDQLNALKNREGTATGPNP